MFIYKKVTETAILCGEPLIGYSPTDVQQWIQESGNTDAVIAEAVAVVGQKVGWLHHELNDPDNSDMQIKKFYKEFNLWENLEKKLVSEIICRLDKQNLATGTNHALKGKGFHYIIEPFMEQNGFRNSSGWWIKRDCRKSAK